MSRRSARLETCPAPQSGHPPWEWRAGTSDGTGLERITDNEGFDGFPMFNREGKGLVFASSRGATAPREFNIFLADWLDDPGDPADPEAREVSNVDG